MTAVWVTRDEPADGPLCQALRTAGLRPVLHPAITRRIVADISGALAALAPDDWLVLTSEFAIRAIPAQAVRCRVAVVGEPSRAAAESRGLRVARLSPDSTGEGLWRSLALDPAGAARILYPRSSEAPPPPDIPGVRMNAPVFYETLARPIDPRRIAGITIAAVASPSAVAPVLSSAPSIRCASIGPTTSTALRRRGVEPWAQASEPTFPALARAIADQLTASAAGLPATSSQTQAPHK